VRRAALALVAGLAVAVAAPAGAPAKKPRKHCVVKHRHGKRVRVCRTVKHKPSIEDTATTAVPPVVVPSPVGGGGGVVSGGSAGGDSGGATTTTPPGDPAPPTNPSPPLLPHRAGVDLSEYSVRPTYSTVAAGDLEFDPVNHGMDAHDFSIRNGSGQITSVPLASGDSAVVNVNLPAGTYTLYCSLLDHETLGMKATLSVQ
jgi:plastocyanin